MDVILIRTVSSCWISGKDSAEALFSPNDTLCLPAFGHARWVKIRKEEENTTLIPGNSLGKNFRGSLLLLVCIFQSVVFGFFFPVKGLNYFLIMEEEVYFYCFRAAVQNVVI